MINKLKNHKKTKITNYLANKNYPKANNSIKKIPKKRKNTKIILLEKNKNIYNNKTKKNPN